MATVAENYRNNGYTHVMIEIINFGKGVEIKGFRCCGEMKKYKGNMSFSQIESGLFSFMTVKKAIKKGY